MIITLDSFITGDGTYTLNWDNSLPTNDAFVVFTPTGFGTQQGIVSTGDRGYSLGDYVTSKCTIDSSLSLVEWTATLADPFIVRGTIAANSPSCGFTPSCDLAFTGISLTNCTTAFNNDGTITVSVFDSHSGVVYSLDNITFQPSNSFTGLIPGTYTVFVKDIDGCHINQSVTIYPSSAPPPTSSEKYQISFTTEKDNLPVVLKIFDTQNSFPKPLQITSQGNNPIQLQYQNDAEFKFQPIIGLTLTANIIADGVFDPYEFAFAGERRWKGDLYINGVMEFQGWLLPDEIQKSHEDEPYNFQLIFTDGLASLKGVDFVDLNNAKIYGLYPLITVWQYCFAQLGYDIGLTKLISSLTCSFATDIIDQWNKTLIWGDAFYDSSGIPDDCYTVFEKTMSSFGLQLFQYKGSFVMRSTADLQYNVSANTIEFDSTFNSAMTGTLVPAIKEIGVGLSNHPVNPPQGERFDKAISTLNGTVTFNQVSLLNKDPSFEYGSIEGQLPIGWKQASGYVPAFLHFSPTTSYSGDWVLRIGGVNADTRDTNAFGVNFFDQISGYLIDQGNKKIRVSFYFRPHAGSHLPEPRPPFHPYFPFPVFALMFVGDSGNFYWFNTGDNNDGLLGHWDLNPEKPFPNSIKYAAGSILTSSYISFFDVPPLPVPYIVSFETDQLPETGKLFLRLCPIAVFTSPNLVSGYAIGGTGSYVDIDNLQITSVDAGDDFTILASEIHRFVNKQLFAKSETKELTSDFYNYLPNKYISGNVLYGTNYVDAKNSVTAWSYALGNLVGNRLPRIIFESVARNYQRPMIIFDGDIRSDDIDFFNIYQFDSYSNKKFMLLSLTRQIKEGINTVVAVEIDNTDFNKTYTYIPKYKNSARGI